MKKNKGLTLVELLGVIAILAILVLVAVPAVTNIITKSSRNSFKNEILGIVKDMDKAYTYKITQKVKNVNEDDTVNDDQTIYNVILYGVGYKYLCMSLNDLVKEQYTNKDLGVDYGGYIQMWVPSSTGETVTYINTTNSRFYLQGFLSKISDSEFTPTQAPTVYLDTVTTSTKCPSSYKMPNVNAHNIQDGEKQEISF